MQKRTRHFTVELRTGDDLGEGVAEAYVTTWDTEYLVSRWDNTFERIDRSAFDLSKPRPLFYEHDWDAGPIGEQTFRADAKGLRSRETYYLDDPRARSVWRNVKSGALPERSIGFIPDEDGIQISKRSSGGTLETITKGDLVESSVVVRGANPDTETVSTRAVPAVPVASPAAMPQHPATPGASPVPAPVAVPGMEEEDEKPTPAGLISEIAEVVQMAIELKMDGQLLDLVKQSLKLFAAVQPAAPPPPLDPAVAAAAAAAARSSVELPSSAYAALARYGFSG